MQVTKDMVRDLLPVYLAGEASADTRAVVESYLEKDAGLRDMVEGARAYSLPPVEVPDSLEVKSLNRTRRLLGRKNFWLGFALIFSFAPLALGRPWIGDLGMLIGLGGWVAFLLSCRKLSATGLEAPHRRMPRIVWGAVGWLFGAAAGYLIDQQTGGHSLRYFLGAVTFGVTLWIGEKFHQVPTPEEYSRPTTLFGK